MRIWASLRLVCGALAWLAVGPASAAQLGPGVEEVQRCIEANLPERTARQHVLLERRDRAGNERRIEAVVWWKRDGQDRSRILARVEAPPDERGTGFLMIENESGTELFSYLPELGRVRRVTSRSANAFLGTDLSFEDLEELQAVAERARVERLPDATLGGRPVYVLAGTPDPAAGSAYERVVSQVDRETCVSLRTSLEGAGGRVLKELVVDVQDLEKRGARWLPRKVLFRNHANESETRLTLQQVELDLELSDQLFTQGELAKGN